MFKNIKTIFLLGIMLSIFMVEQNFAGFITIRKASMEDEIQLKQLYCSVAAIPGGLIRVVDEITDDYINRTLSKGTRQGLALVVEMNGLIIGSMIKYRPEPQAFLHVLAEGSILVHPDYQGRGVGSMLIKTFLHEVEHDYPDIYRIELVARASNPAIKLYEKHGFVREGTLRNKVKNEKGVFEDDILLAWVRGQ